VDVDPVLAARVADQRRGLTVIARPSPAVRQRAGELVRDLRDLEPDQHYYRPGELHLTVLSLFTATVDHGPHLAQTEQYVSAVDSALRQVAPIRIEFEGVTASAAAVMIQGFFEDDTLNHLRNALRGSLRDRGLGEKLDERYRLEVSHLAVARFRAPLRNGERFAAALECARQRPFGATTIASLCLVKHDWYMTHRVVETVKRYRLSGAR
jgi:2'-5' RNA ligase